MINKKVLMAVSVSALLLSGCFNSETGASQRAANGETETHAPAKHEAKEAHVAEKAAPVAEEAKAEEKAPAAEEAKAEEKAPAAEEAKAEEKAPAAEEAKAEEKAPAAKEEAAPAAAATPDLGACKGCHGANFEKSAMGKSKEVNKMSKADIAKALKGYKDGSYGGAMKGLMKGQVASFDDAAIDAIANTIGK